MTEAAQSYEARVEALRRALLAAPKDTPVRLRKRTSNLFRPRDRAASRARRRRASAACCRVDPVARTADVGGMTTYEDLVDATLPHGLMPLVVPQLKTITLGGAVTGLGIESTSFRNGCRTSRCCEMESSPATAEVVTATPDGEHADLFHGFPNSYGTLGYALRLAHRAGAGRAVRPPAARSRSTRDRRCVAAIEADLRRRRRANGRAGRLPRRHRVRAATSST